MKSCPETAKRPTVRLLASDKVEVSNEGRGRCLILSHRLYRQVLCTLTHSLNRITDQTWPITSKRLCWSIEKKEQISFLWKTTLPGSRKREVKIDTVHLCTRNSIPSGKSGGHFPEGHRSHCRTLPSLQPRKWQAGPGGTKPELRNGPPGPRRIYI